MAERMKDAEDRMLESMFESQPIADDGFSVRVVRKVNRRLWMRRLMLPMAAVIGGAIAFKPLAGLVTLFANFVSLIPEGTVSNAASAIPGLDTVLLGAVLLAAALVGVRMLED